MSYELKKGDKVICDFSLTSDDDGQTNRPRIGTFVKETGIHGATVNFGRGFKGWPMTDGGRRTYWFVSQSELWVPLSKVSK